jgi:arylsulfatase
VVGAPPASAQAAKEPNSPSIMGDDIGLMQPPVYHSGWRVGAAPSIDRIAHEGDIFMDHSAMQSGTSGRATLRIPAKATGRSR